MRYRIDFSYDGTNFNGYQLQPNLRTVQNELEKAVSYLNRQTYTQVQSSGRTDKGVHALNQVAHFDLDIEIPLYKIKRGLNSNLPADIHVINVKSVSNNFHARFSVKKKEYIYRINIGEYNPMMRNYVYQYNKRLDVVEMERALKYLEGVHNFKAFTKTNEENIDDYERKIIQATLIRNYKDVNKVTISLLGTGFLRYMVRNIVGTLIEIGEGKRKSEDIITILESQDRRQAGKTAHPEGLYLKDVFY